MEENYGYKTTGRETERLLNKRSMTLVTDGKDHHGRYRDHCNRIFTVEDRYWAQC